MEKIINKISCQQFNGESPIYDPGSGKVFFVDTGNPVCIEYDTELGKTAEYKLDDNLQCIAMTESGGWIGTTNDKILIFDKDFNVQKKLDSPDADKAHMNLSDGTVGPDGCFYFGSMNHDDLYSTEGCIYKVNIDLSIVKVIDNLALPNGIAFSNDGNKCYITEMFGSAIWIFDFDNATSEFSNKTKFVDVPEADGFPDGLIIDADGYLYSAHWAGFRITRYAPDGSIERVIKIPVPTPTCMAFGGGDRSTLYVTTARKALTDEELEKYPESGDYFILETNFKGRDESLFKG